MQNKKLKQENVTTMSTEPGTSAILGLMLVKSTFGCQPGIRSLCRSNTTLLILKKSSESKIQAVQKQKKVKRSPKSQMPDQLRKDSVKSEWHGSWFCCWKLCFHVGKPLTPILPIILRKPRLQKPKLYFLTYISMHIFIDLRVRNSGYIFVILL